MASPIFTRKTLLLTLAATVLGLATGWLFRSPATTTEASVSGAKSRLSDRAAPPGAPARRAMLPQTQARLEALRNAGIPSRQIAAALDFAKLTSVEEIRDLLENSHHFPAHSAEEVAEATLLKRWLELEPDGALEYCRLHKSDMLARLLGTWSVDEPEKAAAWVKAMPSGQMQREAWMGLCSAAAARDPAAAWAMLTATPGMDLRYGSWQIDNTVKMMVGKDPEYALAHLDSQPPLLLPAIRKALAAKLMDTDPVRAWEWVRRQPNPGEPTAAALGVAFEKNPAQAMELLQSLPREELKTFFSHHVHDMELHRRSGIAGVLINARGLDPEDWQSLASNILSMTFHQNPAEALELSAMMGPDQWKPHLQSYINNRLRYDKAAARTWVENLPEGRIRTAAMETLAADQGEGDNPKTRSLASDLKNHQYIQEDDPRFSKITAEEVDSILKDGGTNRNHQFTRFFGQLTDANPSAAATWLQTTEIDIRTGPMAARFSAKWAETDPTAAAAWVKTLPPGDLARTAAANVALHYARYAPAEAQTWADQLPPGPVQEAARTALQKDAGGQ